MKLIVPSIHTVAGTRAGHNSDRAKDFLGVSPQFTPLPATLGMLTGVPRTSPRSVLLASALLFCVVISGCRGGRAGAPGSEPSSADGQRRLLEEVRSQLEVIPPPTKSKFANVHSLEVWSNPYLTVQDNLLVLHVTVADANTSNFGQDGMLRPVGARRQVLSIRAPELPAALNAIPVTAWPYGRVLAIEEAHNTPKSAEPQVRRTMENVMRTLNDLGVVVYEWTENGPEIR